MAFIIRNPIIGVQAIANTSTTKNHPLGTIVVADDPTYGSGEFIYLKGATNTVVGSVVTYNMDDGSTTLAVANAVGPIALSMSINVSTGYGWYQIQGKGVAKVLSGFLDNADCYLTATDGSIDDTDLAGDYINRMKGASAIDTPSTGLAEVELARPSVSDGKDN